MRSRPWKMAYHYGRPSAVPRCAQQATQEVLRRPRAFEARTPRARIRVEGLDRSEIGRFRAPRAVAAPVSRG